MNRVRKSLGILAGTFLLLGSVSLLSQTARTNAPASKESVSGERIIRYIRDKFGVAEAVKMTVDPFRESGYPDFFESTVTVGEGKEKRVQKIYITKTRRYLIVGNLYLLGADPKGEIVRHVRELFQLPGTTSITVGAFRNSAYPNLSAMTITADDGKQKQTQEFHVTKDNRCLVLGSIFPFSADPKGEVLRTISIQNQPSLGPANAPVTIVEYADLQCGNCARLHEFMEKELLPKYGDRVRIVFKEFPLVKHHDWALTAAIASQCVYQINQQAFGAYRSLIFRNQSNINLANARTLLVDFGQQAGVDRLRLATCIDSKASLPRVEANASEGKTIGVVSTPTCFINGKVVVGTPPPETFYSLVEEALRGAR